MSRWVAPAVLLVVLAPGCGRWFGDRAPVPMVPADVQRAAFEIVARNNQCEPSVLAADRQGRALLITFQVTSVGKQHIFQIPELNVRATLPAGTQVSLPVLVERSGIYRYGCNSFPWLGPLATKGKLAIK